MDRAGSSPMTPGVVRFTESLMACAFTLSELEKKRSRVPKKAQKPIGQSE
jgi:hypothetical protein